MLDLHRLRLLRELKHRGTLAAVAAALSYSPSSVSQQLAALEREVGARLLEPAGRRVRLTEQAEILVAHTEALLERVERAEADVARSLGGVTGTLRVATFQTAALALLPATLTLLREAHPDLRLSVTQAEPEHALPALLGRDHDLVIAEEYPGRPGPRSREIEEEDLHHDEIRMALPAGGPGAAGTPDAPGPGAPAARGAGEPDPADCPWIMEPTSSASRQWATALCRAAGFEPDVRFESTDLLLHARLAAQGHAAALLPDLVWAFRDAPPPVALRPLPGGPAFRRLYTAVRRGSGAHPAVRAVRAALREAVTTLTARPTPVREHRDGDGCGGGDQRSPGATSPDS
ncbi:LysR family transcriptional regulator [Streptomyces sp. URMC 123]|uniref:LysR family transcriptional regulator n=1 Tax=Streptomyces sp. URMC 123 TaxID=3423403 RepID=UPI003F1DD675